MRIHWLFFLAVSCCHRADLLRGQTVERPDTISFNRDIRPILAQKCFVCHGRDEADRQADLRLDVRDEAIGSGAIMPGDPEASEVMARVASNDQDERMPPPGSAAALNAKELDLLRRWIEGGAPYDQHWAFEPPASRDPPATVNEAWVRNPIDRFVLQQLEANGLTPASEGDRYTLVRRLYLDLIGLPPTPEQADQFVQSRSSTAYEDLVDELLASPHYGERWAQPWLDLARYSDTNGYEKDRPRSMWPYRDWVIRALNRDLAFDEFTIEQLAGDMMPEATPDQIIATGFHRNTMLNEEGGIDPLEYRFLAMVDRVATTGAVWLGMTMECAQCHTHKYDPITQNDYYRFMALMNNADEPDYFVPDSGVEARREDILARIETLESQLIDKFPRSEEGSGAANTSEDHFRRQFTSWIETTRRRVTDWSVLRPESMESNMPRLELMEDGSVYSSGDITKRDVFRFRFDVSDFGKPVGCLKLEAIPDLRLPGRGPGRTYYEGRKGDFFVSEIAVSADGDPVALRGATMSNEETQDSLSKSVIDGDGSTGWQPGERKAERMELVLQLAEPVEAARTIEVELLFERHYSASLGRFRFWAGTGSTAVASDLPPESQSLLADFTASEWNEDELKRMTREFLLRTPLLAEQRKEIDQLRQQLPDPPHVLVLQERPADFTRRTWRHHRGEYLSPREEVSPGIPEFLLDANSAENHPANRLELARWLVSEQNPLVARVVVNRAWQAFFGEGLVRTSEDFGVQSEAPSHPGLLDWLAVEWIRNGRSMKKLHRLIVCSATYRQSSGTRPESLQRDPENRLLSRGPRFRLPGETIRDSMLLASGLLSPKMYGPGVRPPQPDSVTALAWAAPPWQPSEGEDRFRRSIYTFRKRTAPFAAYLVFDAPTGETCVVRRNRSNTPLQALTLLNDEMYLEMNRSLARWTVGQAFESPAAAVNALFRRFLTRPPDEAETSALVDFFTSQLDRLKAGELDASLIMRDDTATADQAAWMMVARTLMNLDEAVNKQ